MTLVGRVEMLLSRVEAACGPTEGKSGVSALAASEEGDLVVWATGWNLCSASRDPATGKLGAAVTLYRGAIAVRQLGIRRLDASKLRNPLWLTKAVITVVAVGFQDGSIAVLTADAGKVILRMGRAHKGPVLGLQWLYSPELHLASISVAGVLRIRDVTDLGRISGEKTFEHPIQMELSRDGTFCAVAHCVSKVTLLQLPGLDSDVDLALAASSTCFHPVRTIRVSPDSTLVAALYENGTIALHSRSGKLLSFLKNTEDILPDLQLLPQGNSLATLAQFGKLRILHVSGEASFSWESNPRGDLGESLSLVAVANTPHFLIGHSDGSVSAVSLPLGLPSLAQMAKSALRRGLIGDAAALPLPRRLCQFVDWHRYCEA